MIQNPMDVLEQFPVRKSKQQKQAFRDAVQSYAQSLDYDCRIEKGKNGVHNIVIGDPERASYLVTAHYDTCARLPFPNIVTPLNPLAYLLYQFFIIALYVVVSIAVGVAAGLLLKSAEAASLVGLTVYWILLILMMVGPANPTNANDNTSGVVTVLETAKHLPAELRSKVCFVLFDLEEAGLIGSAVYRKLHKNVTNSQIILNLDCVGDGDEILFIPNKKLRKDAQKLHMLNALRGNWGEKSIAVHEKGFAVYPSDQKHFPYGVAIAAFRRGFVGLYYDRIHTKRDVILDEGNVSLLTSALCRFLSRQEGEI